MLLSFADQGTEDIYDGTASKKARKALPSSLWGKARLKMEWLSVAVQLDDLKIPPGNKLHALKDDRKGQHAIRINDQYRICFRWTAAGPEDVEITDYH